MYSAKEIEKIENRPGTWNSLKIGVFQDDVQIGEYVRNYSTMFNTFFPFTKDGKDYALYSKDYVCTRIMSLPDCKDMGGEEAHSHGFCPVEYYVPSCRDYSLIGSIGPEPKIYRDTAYCKEMRELEKEINEGSDSFSFEGSEKFLNFGLVAGCVWGDDTSMKIQYLDLSEVDKGILKRDERFGYIHLPEGMNLVDAVDMTSDAGLKLTTTRMFDPRLDKNNDWDSVDYAKHLKTKPQSFLKKWLNKLVK